MRRNGHDPFLLLEQVAYRYPGMKDPIIEGISLAVEPGDFIGLVGPNGSGKSTLLKIISGYFRPFHGEVLLQGLPVHRMPRAEAARSIAVMGQFTTVQAAFTVEEMIRMGTYAWNRALSQEEEDSLLDQLGLDRFRGQPVTELSGGEKQRVFLAQTLAQNPSLLLLDEPTAHLDLRYQLETLEILHRWNMERGTTVIVVLHDLNLAASYCRRIMMLSEGRMAAEGPPEQVLTAETIELTYGLEAVITFTPSGTPRVIMVPPTRTRPIEKHGMPLIHVIGGGGSAAWLLQALSSQGFRVTLAPVNTGDADQKVAEKMGLAHCECPPFSPLEGQAVEWQKEAIRKADAIVVAPVPFGAGNLSNLKAVVSAAELNTPIFLVDDGSFANRDFVQGQAHVLFDRLKPSAAMYPNDHELMMALSSWHRKKREEIGEKSQ